MIVHTDCRHYKGDIPCRPHKREGVHCQGCPHYDAVDRNILIIKLGAIGDVIRTTPLLHKLKSEFPGARIHWLTHTPDVVPSQVDRIYPYDLKSLEIIKQTPFDLALNLDKDAEACALLNQINAHEKRGFRLENGFCHPLGEAAKDKWLTGLFDDVNQKNTKSYLEEIFEISGFPFEGEEYILEIRETGNWNIPSGKPVIGLNTGCGTRWLSRLWPEPYWKALADLLTNKGYTVLFLGGPQEHEKNTRLSEESKGIYPGTFSLPLFMDLMNQCDLVVTAVSMAMHIALGLKKKLVLFNNIFNANEFELYGRGVILEPPKTCKGCFMGDCEDACMELIEPQTVLESIISLLRWKDVS